jgi:DNA processing protein
MTEQPFRTGFRSEGLKFSPQFNAFHTKVNAVFSELPSTSSLNWKDTHCIHRLKTTIMGESIFYQIAITLIPKIGPVLAKTLISYCGGVEAVFRTPKKQLLAIPGIGPALVDAITRGGWESTVEKELYFIEQHQIQTFFYLEKDYPSRLKHYPDAPLLLYFKGNASLNHLRTVGVIGTREPSFYGKALCEELVEALAPYQAQIISGLAFGVDITAHRAALQSGQETIGVLGNGLQQIYPFHHREIAMRMIDQGGLLTELPSFKGPDREHFPMRNRIVAALSDAVIVVETATKGGSMITARLANDYNKDVFAFPGRVGDPKSEGCNLLIKSHRAHLIEQVEDLVYTLRWEPQTPQQTELFVELDEAEKQVVQLVRAKPEISVDELAYEMAHPISQLAPLLLSLEFKGMVRALPGNRYVAM